MGLIVTLTGNAGKHLIRGAIWELGASAYRAYVHVVPSAPGLEPSRAVPVVESVKGPTLQGVLDAAIGRVMTRTGNLVENLQVHAVPATPKHGTEEGRALAAKPSNRL
jgi:hypothetical protein